MDAEGKQGCLENQLIDFKYSEKEGMGTKDTDSLSSDNEQFMEYLEDKQKLFDKHTLKLAHHLDRKQEQTNALRAEIERAKEDLENLRQKNKIEFTPELKSSVPLSDDWLKIIIKICLWEIFNLIQTFEVNSLDFFLKKIVFSAVSTTAPKDSSISSERRIGAAPGTWHLENWRHKAAESSHLAKL